jgi:hypothetical protein
MAEAPPKTFVPQGGQASGFRLALEKYAKGKNGQPGAGDSEFGKNYLDPGNQTDMSDADKSYLASTGGDVSGLMGEYAPQVQAPAPAYSGPTSSSEMDRATAILRGDRPIGGTVKYEKSWQDNLGKVAQDIWNKPYIATLPKLAGGQVGSFADSLKKNTYL